MKTDLYGRDIPWLLRAIGCFGVEARGWRYGCLRFRWAEFSTSKGLALSLDHQDGDGHSWMLHIRLLIVQAFIYLPGPRREVRSGTMGESWGFSWNWGHEWGNGDSIHLHWGYRTKLIYMPWGWDWVRTSFLLGNGMWISETKFTQAIDRLPTVSGPRALTIREQVDAWAWRGIYEYRYTLRSGEVQRRKATVKVEEMEWRWRALRWLPWPRKVSRTIAVEFDGEVGERSGSWKGGTIGCGYELRHSESPLQCLRRMEVERKF